MTDYRNRFDLSLYLITDTGLCNGPDGVIHTVAAAVDGGVSMVQLRDPNGDDSSLSSLGRELLTVLEPRGIPLIVNDRADIAREIGAAGVHLGQSDQDVESARELLGPSAIIGLSVQTLNQVQSAQSQLLDLDYLGVGPVWATHSKPDHAPPIGVSGATDLVAASPWPCVLIGGIHPHRVASLGVAGAAGIAVVSAICGQPDPEHSARELRVLWQEGRR